MTEIESINKSVFFLFFIDSTCDLMGSEMAKGMLQRLGEKIAYSVLEKYSDSGLNVNNLEELANTSNTLKYFDDTLVFEDEKLYILEKCPFSELIVAYKALAQTLPANFAEITESYNQEGLGYAVSPFCIIHQTYRRIIGENVKVNGKDCTLLQLGCKAGSGTIKFAEDNLNKASIGKDTVTSKLENRACIYTIQIKE